MGKPIASLPHQSPVPSEKCLHCRVWDAVNALAPQNPKGPGVLYDPGLIIGNLIEVIGEVVAGIPDRNARRLLMSQVDDRLREYVAECIAKGNHPGAINMSMQ